MADLFGVERRSSGRTTTLACWGEIDASVCPALRSQIDEALRDGRMTQLVLDLTRTTFCDTTGLSLLIAADRMTRTSMRLLRILRPADPDAYRVFEVTGLDALLPFAVQPVAGEALPA